MRSIEHRCLTAGLSLAAVALQAAAAFAILDNGDRGPSLTAGGFTMRVTNAGIVGNAFYGVGLSSDPSFEFPAGSGNECLNYAALWVGARLPSGAVRVSGGPNLEWRPTLDPEDRVRTATRGALGSQRLVDDDGDGGVDEEWLDGRDNDGDGWVDEDLGLEADQIAAAAYSDTERAAIALVYPNGEIHEPLHLSVRQKALAWSSPGLQGIAGLEFTITNIGPQPLADVYAGFYADLDSRRRSDATGHLDDRVRSDGVSLTVHEPSTSFTAGAMVFQRDCVSAASADFVTLYDGDPRSRLPGVAVVPLDHTVDPLALIPEARSYGFGPARVQFHTALFLAPGTVARGGAPILDGDRYDALRGLWPEATADARGDYACLVSCGPFPRLDPGRQITIALGIVAGQAVDSVRAAADRLLLLYHGVAMNLLPDSLPDSERDQYRSGATGTFGHEACLEAPPGIRFVHDPHCTYRFPDFLGLPPADSLYEHGRCIWTNADCNWCTGANGNETRVHWFDAGAAAPAPQQLCVPGDHAVAISWDNLPEVLAASGRLGPWVRRVIGYRLYKLADWRDREGTLPPRANWALARAFSVQAGDTLNGERPLAQVTDTTLDYQEILYEQRHYGIGRYRLVDPEVHNGFDYAFRVTTVAELAIPGVIGTSRLVRVETPLVASFADLVAPHARSRGSASEVWVVPNPYRAHSAWDRPPVSGDPLGRHIDFMGLPRAPCTIKIWTVAGDLVARVDHDGSSGDGEASWNLISRNGQETESGIYIFTVDSPLGHSVGRFVVIR